MVEWVTEQSEGRLGQFPTPPTASCPTGQYYNPFGKRCCPLGYYWGSSQKKCVESAGHSGVPTWKYVIVWEWLPPLQRWGVRLAHLFPSYGDNCESAPDIRGLDPQFYDVPTYKIYEEYWWTGKWVPCADDGFIIPTRNWS